VADSRLSVVRVEEKSEVGINPILDVDDGIVNDGSIGMIVTSSLALKSPVASSCRAILYSVRPFDSFELTMY
jgi:hypothetical protein